ncbi:MAG: auxin efflux carrier [Rickettsiales bacterium]|nr:auxin efflux carrier [Rickettsiales bacterium]|tara:strand:+ start:140 stop:1069 length:930 start_codon:yes stop_codon:yes gene_type:complete
MYTVLSITIPFFAIIFLGTFFRAKNIFDDNSSKTLTKFTFFVTLPPFIFINIIKSSNDNNIFQWDFIVRFEIITVLIFLFSLLFAKFLLNYNNRDASLFSLNSSYPNYGYMGIPLSILAFGENAAIPISIILLADTIVLLTLTSFFASNNSKKGSNNFFFNMINILKNPLLAAALIGFIFVIFNIPIYSLIYKILNLLSLAAPPTALFALGITLWNKVDNNFIKSVSMITILKLIVHPLLIFIVFNFFPSSVPTIWIKVAILCSCLPVAANVFAMAGYYETFVKQTSSAILVTTILSTISVPIILYFLF